MEPLRVFIIADDPLVRAGVAALLDDQSIAAVVGQAASTGDLAAALEASDPEVIVWDAGGDPSAASARLAALDPDDHPTVALIADEKDAADVLAAGARGLLPRDVDPSTLLTALQAVASGLLVLDPSFSPVAQPARGRESPPMTEDLTPRELEVLQLMAEGLSNKEIARRLGLSEHTAKFHVNAVLSKLDAHSRTEAVTRAARTGLIIL